MAKKKRTPPTHIDVALTMPIDVLKCYEALAKASGVSPSDCVAVALGWEILRHQASTSKPGSR